jgi:hypothetical protein
MNNVQGLPSRHCILTLADELPGPSEGDAAEHLQALGFDPWALEKLLLIHEQAHDRQITAKFMLVGDPKLIQRIAEAEEDHMNRTTDQPAHANPG